jgi:hypothetical protein
MAAEGDGIGKWRTGKRREREKEKERERGIE